MFTALLGINILIFFSSMNTNANSGDNARNIALNRENHELRNKYFELEKQLFDIEKELISVNNFSLCFLTNF
jgi:hypothetical protein